MMLFWLQFQSRIRRRAREARLKLSTMLEAFLLLFVEGWVTIRHQKKRSSSARTNYKAFADTGQSDGTSTRVFQIGNGLYNLRSTHLTSTPWTCAPSTVQKTVIFIF